MKRITLIFVVALCCISVGAQSDYYMRQARSYQHEAEYYTSQAQGYDRETGNGASLCYLILFFVHINLHTGVIRVRGLQVDDRTDEVFHFHRVLYQAKNLLRILIGHRTFIDSAGAD